MDQNGRNVEDHRVLAVAAQTVRAWGYGMPPDYASLEDKPLVTTDSLVLTREERAAMLAIISALRTMSAV